MKKYSDVTLRVGNEEFRSHRLLLATHCTYFCDLPNFEKLTTITLKNTEPDTLNKVLMYLYLADVEVPHDQVQSMMEAAEILRFKALRRQCKYVLVSAQPVTPANCLEVWPVALENDDQDLSREDFKITLEYFSRLQHAPAYRQLPDQCIHEYVSYPGLKVSSKDDRLNALLVCVKAESGSRAVNLSGSLATLTEDEPVVLAAGPH